MSYTRFDPPHLLSEYVGHTGYEVEGLALSPSALEAVADEKMTGARPLVVIGKYHYPDGSWYLDLAVPTGYIETTTDFRWDENRRRLRLVCPDCEMKDGKHSKACAA